MVTGTGKQISNRSIQCSVFCIVTISINELKNKKCINIKISYDHIL